MLLFYEHLDRKGPMSSIYTRSKNGAGFWRYARVKEGRGQRTSKLEPPFYTRPCVNGKQTWTPLNAITFDDAKEEASYLDTAMEAHSKGLTVTELDTTTNAHRVPIKTAVDVYMEQKKGKAKKTIQQYRLTLNGFIEAMAEKKIRFLDAVTVPALR